MSCDAIIHCWTFGGLVGAFLDLGIAFFLLFASTIAYLASKFLGLFGLCLPGDPIRQKALVEWPPEKTASVLLLVKHKFPFNSIWADTDSDPEHPKRNHKKRHVGEASSTGGRSLVEGNNNEAASVFGTSPAGEQGRFHFKGGVQRKRLALRHRHKGKAVDCGKSSPFSLDATQTPSSVGKIGIQITEEGTSVPVNSGEALPVAEFRSNSDETNTILVLEQALEEERTAHSALYLELEKERSAAATAADETMAMILRLQEEKALIGMEAKQYQRLIEEKSAYDAEEMNILKEILLRREREKHFLEKEVEACRQMIFGNDQLDAGVEATKTQGISSLLYSSEDPMLMLQQISSSMYEKEMVKNRRSSRDDEESFDLQNRTIAFGKELQYPELDEDAEISKGDICSHRHPSTDKHPDFVSCDGFQEKGMVSMDENSLTQQRELQTQEACSQSNQSSTQGFNLHVESNNPAEEGREQSDNIILSQRLATTTIESLSDTELHIHDVHVIDDESSMSNEVRVNKTEQLLRNASLNLHRIDDSLTLSRLETGLGFNRSRSDLTSGLPPKVPLRSKTLVSDLRRNSMSAIDLRRNSMSSIDYERLKIDNEVEMLHERLRIVQEGREKLKFSLGNKERENFQLQLLEDIASQLREIRRLTDPGKAIRQASLPPPSSKVCMKLPAG
ncbi:myosin-binding protein 2 [Quercus suber]|uniref:Myosin-binding protein 2 n=1 Tax=Quercus suber TaxID=58331 RepID=A0AAW0L6A5_QUESU